MSANASIPFSYNLLELYRQHRDEVDVLTDQTSLFILAFTNEMKSVDIDALAGDLHLSLTALGAKLTPLLRGQMMLDSKGILTVSALGRRVLIELSFIPPIPPGPVEPPKKPEPPTQPHKSKLVRRADVPKPVPTQVAGTPGWLWGIIAFFITGVLVFGSLIVAIIIWPQPTPPPPRITPQAFFSADRTNLNPGDCTFLRWNVQGGDWVELDGRRVSFSDSTQVCPTRSTVYSLVVGGDIGVNRNVQIIVETPPPPPPSQVQISFNADRPSINQGECTLLRWNVQGGYSVQLDGQRVERIGQKQVCPRQTTTYQLAVDVGDRMDRSEVVVAVAMPPPPASGALRGSVNRAADALPIPNAQIQISSGPSTAAPNGSYSISNLAPGNYSVTANAPGYNSKTQSVSIVAGQTATLNFQLTKQAIASDNSVSLTPYWCFDFASRQSVPPPKGPGCQQPADFQWIPDIYGSPEIRNVGDTRIGVANPQSNAYEACMDIPDSSVTDLYQGEFVCVLTRTNQIAVIRLVKFDKNQLTPLTFDWVLYSNP